MHAYAPPRETERDSRGVVRAAVRRCMCPSVANAAGMSTTGARQAGSERCRSRHIHTPHPDGSPCMHMHMCMHRAGATHHPSRRIRSLAAYVHPFPRGQGARLDHSWGTALDAR